MTVSVSLTRWALLGLLLGLLSCNSGGTGGTGIDDQPGRSVVVFGAVTDMGSIVVNGIAFDTADATITRNGQPGAEADLQVGQVVTVRGTRAPSGVVGTAESVAFDRNAQGPIASIDPATNSLIVLGQLVQVDATTQFGAIPFRDLAVGNIVEISGFADAEGVLRATRIDKTQDVFMPGIDIEVEGTITNLDAGQQTFMLNTLRVDFSMLNLPEGLLSNGQVVAVKSLQNVMDDVLVANSVEVKAVGIQGDPEEAVELQGIITRVLSEDTFEVNGQLVQITPDTVFEVGTADNIAEDVRVEVEGVFDADGIVIVEEVELGAGVELQGSITRVLSEDTFEVDGQPVQITSDTMFAGDSTADDIAVGRRVEVEGVFAEDGVFVATEIDFFVEGAITRVLSEDTFEVDGQRVRLTPETEFEEGTADDIAVEGRVEVEGFFAEDDVFVATEIEFLQ